MQEKQKNSANYLMISIFLSSLLLILNPFQDFSINSFKDRAIGRGLMFGVDITKITNSLYLLLFVMIPILAIIIFKIAKKYLKPEHIKRVNVISTLGIINLILAFINSLNDSKFLIVSVYTLAGIDIIILIASILQKTKNLKWTFLSALPVTFFITYMLHIANIVIKDNIVTWLIVYFVDVFILLFIINLKKINDGAMKKAYIFFLIAPLLESLYLEAYNILNQHNIILIDKAKQIIAIYAICFIASVICYILNRKKEIKFKYTRYYYPIIIITIALMSSAIGMVTKIDGAELFESANHGLAVYELFKNGKIPIIETFDAHMMYNQIFGIIYGILNWDITGAIFCIYKHYNVLLISLIIYCFLKKIFPRDIAFLMTLFFPTQWYYGYNFYINLLAITTLINAYRKRTFKSFLLYWLSLVFLCFLRLDFGIAASVSTVAVLIYIWIRNRKNIKLRNILIPLAIVIIVFLSLYLGICTIKNINPIARIIEFLKISMSNVTWGYDNLGEPNLIAYTMAYYVMPLIVIGTLIYTIYKTKGKLNNINIILIALGLFFIINFQRGLVRHSLVERKVHIVFGLALLYLSIFVYKNANRKVRAFSITHILLLMLSTLLIAPEVFAYENLFDGAMQKRLEYKNYDEIFTEKVERVELSQEMKDVVQYMKQIMDNVLDEDETYLDISNQNLLYALTDREKPVYVNQTPGLLSGELSQQMYLEEVKNSEKEIPIIIKSTTGETSIDGIPGDYRYYLLTEYTYNNYTPVAFAGDYEIWIKNDVLEEKLEKLKQIKNDKIKIVTKEEYLKQKTGEIIEIKQIPVIWGEYDVKKDEEKLQKELEKGIIMPISLQDIEKEKGNYLKLKIDSPKETTIRIKLNNKKQEMSEYIIDLKKGPHNYTIRISTLYGWHENCIDEIVLDTNEEIKVEKASIVEADTIKSIN